MTLAPGIEISMSQTGRLLTDVVSASGVFNLDYDYDEHGNVRSIIDGVYPLLSASPKDSAHSQQKIRQDR